ncbi:hypothetical protein [Trinickia acidisoli]|uniref:hypothetical protein n=1 Tax=Trinickia acidisoli TaxID=2767482 RepID=UPI001A8D462D|nr:hypothetical protein [Trinickia acidisoli]
MKMKTRNLLLIAALLSSVTAGEVYAADAQQTADTPDVKVGDHWEYKRAGLLGDGGASDFAMTVTAVDSDHIAVEQSWGKSGDKKTAQYGRDWSAVSADGGASAVFLNFPLTPGKSWDTVESVINSAGNRIERHIHLAVQGVDHVTVPAGTFDAVKIVGEGIWQNMNPAYSGVHAGFKVTLWYVPSVKQVVRRETVAYPVRHGSISSSEEELAAYSLK